MLTRPREYEAMRAAEDGLWWYRNLNRLVVAAIRRRFPARAPGDLRILDAGCGTGGLLRHLVSLGYTNYEGFDLSPHALELATASGLKLRLLDLKDGPRAY